MAPSPDLKRFEEYCIQRLHDGLYQTTLDCFEERVCSMAMHGVILGPGVLELNSLDTVPRRVIHIRLNHGLNHKIVRTGGLIPMYHNAMSVLEAAYEPKPYSGVEFGEGTTRRQYRPGPNRFIGLIVLTRYETGAAPPVCPPFQQKYISGMATINYDDVFLVCTKGCNWFQVGWMGMPHRFYHPNIYYTDTPFVDRWDSRRSIYFPQVTRSHPLYKYDIVIGKLELPTDYLRWRATVPHAIKLEGNGAIRACLGVLGGSELAIRSLRHNENRKDRNKESMEKGEFKILKTMIGTTEY